jgi:nucleotide-binding universal stress UspA family protein
MQRFKNIFFYIGGEPIQKAAFERTAALTKRNQAFLTVAGTLEALPPEARLLAKFTNPAELQDITNEELNKRLEHLIAPLRAEGIKVSVKILHATPFLEIIREVLRNNHDLVMIAPQSKVELKEMIFGSTAMHLLRKCPCPVWVMKPNRLHRYARILAAVDPSPDGEERKQLNSKIMELAISLAEMEESELHIVHAWTQFAERILSGRAGLSQTKLDEILRETKKLHERWLGELLVTYNLENLKHQVHLLKGEPGKLIPALVRTKQIDFVIMGTLSRTGISGLLIGNTAERVLQQVDCSVLTVKPDSFVTPVKLVEKKRKNSRPHASLKNEARDVSLQM